MKTLKNAEELYDSHFMPDLDGTNFSLSKEGFRKALAEHDQELITEIEKMIKGLIGKSTHGSCCTCTGCKHYYEDDECTCKEIQALTEVINLIKNDKK
jgi:hypothetical protein